MRVKAVLPVLAASAMALGAGVGGASTASAVDRPVTVTSLTAKNLATNGGCKDVQIRVNYRAASSIDVGFKVKVWRGSKYLETVPLYEDHRGYKTGSYFWCYDGLGTFQVKGLNVNWMDWDAEYDWAGNYGDPHTTSFQVKQASNVYATSLTRSKTSPAATTKRLVTAVVRDRYYSNYSDAWVNRKSHYVHLQRKTSTGWKSVKSARTDSRGVAVLRYVGASSKAAWWRIYTPGSSTIWHHYSGQIWR